MGFGGDASPWTALYASVYHLKLRLWLRPQFNFSASEPRWLTNVPRGKNSSLLFWIFISRNFVRELSLLSSFHLTSFKTIVYKSFLVVLSCKISSNNLTDKAKYIFSSFEIGVYVSLGCIYD